MTALWRWKLESSPSDWPLFCMWKSWTGGPEAPTACHETELLGQAWQLPALILPRRKMFSPKSFTPKEGEGFLGQTLPQHKAGSLWRPAEPHKALCSPIKRSLVTCWKSYLTTTATASHCYWTLNTSIILIAPCHWQRSPFSFKAFEELACNRPTGLNRLSES